MLYLIKPPSGGEPTDPPRKRGCLSPALSLTNDEVRHLRAGLHNLRRACGGWAVVGKLTGIPKDTLARAACSSGPRPGAALALRVAKAAGMSVEALLSGVITEAGRCPTCGTRVGDRPFTNPSRAGGEG